MSIETKPGRFFVAQWFSDLPSNMGDVMWVLYQDEGSEKWVVEGRLRVRMDDRIGEDSDDEKRWFEMSKVCGREEAESFADQIFTNMFLENSAGKDVGKFIREHLVKTPINSSDAEQVVSTILKQPFAHVLPTAAGGKA